MELFYLELIFVRKAYCSSSDKLVQKKKKKKNSSNLKFQVSIMVFSKQILKKNKNDSYHLLHTLLFKEGRSKF